MVVMSIITCDRCDRYIDSDRDPDCFVEVGNMRAQTRNAVWCETCRDKEAAYWDRVDEGRQRAKDGEL
jgi:hypothetical protein